ncbi:glutathione S-transferase family protein [Rhizobiaceae bacterium BDR2-2]|uniref:Glutathione S-transferase family protein n=1 Tax=Ectorhizobium quercum TaxID=2965071 RepID=A0AAE3N340_9HYPH|nr:glutathione S-transferase family protein [Ectorhizobium quercum]MCX8999016.1 glutathione S-transferase family protein [Ectorhizobium quercum]
MTRILYTLCGSDADRPFSPHCWKVAMALAHKGLEFTERPVPFTAIPQLEDGFSKTVPILRDGERLVSDSFAIARYLEEVYPDRPSLFEGPGGEATARFVEGWSQTQIHPAVTAIALLRIHDMLDDRDRAYFRASREALLGRTLEEIDAEAADAAAAFAARLQPLRHMLRFQPFLGGEGPLFADYILFGALQWLRITAGSVPFLPDDPASDWFERMLDLHGGLGRSVTPA